ncbi:MAG: hypothetical protein A2297_07420 [Elusimicrobia bacterium RIFOXYB2_FULL_48_7]|nr:MAG: hypothetical protein A2297_07420 [Elusimicrobia bacterium RIFOXYB2_FULL_48_7]
MKKHICVLITTLISFSALPVLAYKQVSCAMHFHSTFSNSGRLSLEEIVIKARNLGISVVIPTDHDLEKVEYGVWPLRKIIKKTVQRNSVFLIGTDKYLDEINRLQQKYPDTVIIPGVESSPYYYWTGNPLKKNMVLHRMHKHLTVIGLNKVKQYRELPISGNPGAGKFDPILLWPCVPLLAGLLIKRKFFRISLITLSCLFFVYNFPFTTYPFSNYINENESPYQYLIDYVNSQGALTFWSHPEARNWKEPYNAGNVSLESPPYPEAILNTRNYTGFAYFWEGANTIGAPGGYWDKTLIQYCNGEREKPVWANSELDYITDGMQNNYLNLNKNILLVKELSQAQALEALKNGRFYMVSKNKPGYFEPVMENFTVKSGASRSTFGEKLVYKGKVKIFFTISTSDKKNHNMKIEFIENGRAIKNLSVKSPSNVAFEFNPSAKCSYCRIELETDNSTKLVTNPVFLYNE